MNTLYFERGGESSSFVQVPVNPDGSLGVWPTGFSMNGTQRLTAFSTNGAAGARGTQIVFNEESAVAGPSEEVFVRAGDAVAILSESLSAVRKFDSRAALLSAVPIAASLLGPGGVFFEVKDVPAVS
ncbi:hypothetical protein Q9Q99_11295 [Curtobacterium flaccumfaciens]|nr:hypothetical protein Q9Q99_11295 [Curtobacterium flaccumfaciens]